MVVNISRILCPVDLSVVSRHALDHACALAKWYGAHLTVLYVCPAPPVPVPPTDLAGDVTVLPPLPPDVVEDDVRRFCGALPDVHGRLSVVVKSGTPAYEILDAADAADLLVMGTHGRSGFERLFLGSITEKVLRSTHRPVLTVPPRLNDRHRPSTKRSCAPSSSRARRPGRSNTRCHWPRKPTPVSFCCT